MSVIAYKCPNCDGELKFDPQTQKFCCEYCISSFSLKDLEKNRPEPDASEEAEQPAPPESGSGAQANLFTCPSCGAQIVASSTTAATECFYCHNPVVLSGRLSGEYLPKKIIPFKISREEAETKFLEWVKRKRFVPRSFVNKKNIEKITGIYFPYWMIDCDVHGCMTASAEKVRRWRSGDIEYTETSYYELIREGNVHFEDLIKNALSHSNREIIDSVQPYDAAGLTDFSMPYLSGFQAEKRDIEKEQLQQEVDGEVRQYTADLLRGTMNGYTSIRPTDGSAQPLRENWDYTLLPVWTVVYRDKKNQSYFYAMNGQTGQIYGNLPLDYRKLGLISGGISALILILGIIGGFLL